VNSSLSVSDRLHLRVQEAISGSTESGGWALSDSLFEELSHSLFEHQYSSCQPYRKFCDGRGITPLSLNSWEDIPAVPTEVFKSVDLFAFSADEAQTVFLTSGTRFGSRGRHLLRTDATYLASLAPGFDRFLLGQARERPLVYVLAPPADVEPASSLSHMLQWAHDHRGAPGSRFFWTPGGPDLHEYASALRAATTPVLLLSTARALQALMDSSDDSWTLPEGSVVMETGGPKKSGMHFDRRVFHAEVAARLGLPVFAVVSEYGMTELGSQGYSPSLLLNTAPTARGAVVPPADDLHIFPPWCKVRALDPDDLTLLPEGRRGLLCFWDLSNVDSVLCVLTADEGIVTKRGVHLLGRSSAASPRGCSLAVEEILGGSD
jgi:hypothetical protein